MSMNAEIKELRETVREKKQESNKKRGGRVNRRRGTRKKAHRALINLILCERLSDQIYLQLDGGKQYCFRLLNATNQVGCQSKEEGNIGVVVYISNKKQFAELYSLDVVRFLKNQRIQGVLLLNELANRTIINFPYSEDSACPNDRFGLYNGSCNQWNRDGAILSEGIRFIDWQKPIFLIENLTEIEIIRKKCYEAFNKKGSLKGMPLCSARLKLFMRAAGNAKICMRRQDFFYSFSESNIALCDPLEDKNVFSIMPPPIKYSDSEKQFKIFILAARMDSFSMMTESAVGDISVLTSLISLLAVAKAIGDDPKEFINAGNSSKRAVMFSFFHGESLGYIGSSRAVADMISKNFPVKLDEFALPKLSSIGINDIEVFVEIQQLHGSENGLFAHVDGEVYTNKRKMIDKLIGSANKLLSEFFPDYPALSIANNTKDSQIPPSSYQTFLKENRNISGFIISPFDNKYSYRRINSFADQNVFGNNSEKIRKEIFASATIALGAIIEFIYGSRPNSSFGYKIDEKFVDTLFDCFITSPDWYSCDFFVQILKNRRIKPEEGTKSTYISSSHIYPSLIRLLIEALLIHCLGFKDVVNVTDYAQCNDLNKHQQVYRFTWQTDPTINLTICYRTAIYQTRAISPAFDNGYEIQSDFYSTWVESVWSPPELVLFLTSYPSVPDFVVFLVGLFFCTLCFLIMEFIYWTNKESIEPRAPSFDADLNAAPL
ncbi:unnamed protein product [Dracunculus medinensis]|uniref:Nicastrin n=1 Tax=Dracunculus medinensis TaxID=318479 RepID=A0A158Q5Z7_DRAME|nr:unnamed protein product [Dracunculus medinensis]